MTETAGTNGKTTQTTVTAEPPVPETRSRCRSTQVTGGQTGGGGGGSGAGGQGSGGAKPRPPTTVPTPRRPGLAGTDDAVIETGVPTFTWRSSGLP